MTLTELRERYKLSSPSLFKNEIEADFTKGTKAGVIYKFSTEAEETYALDLGVCPECGESVDKYDPTHDLKLHYFTCKADPAHAFVRYTS